MCLKLMWGVKELLNGGKGWGRGVKECQKDVKGHREVLKGDGDALKSCGKATEGDWGVLKGEGKALMIGRH